VEVKSVLRIGSAHNNVRTSIMWTLPKFRMFPIFLNINSISYSFRSIANQNGVRYSDSTSYFKKYSSSKCKRTVCLHYGLWWNSDFVMILMLLIVWFWCCWNWEIYHYLIWIYKKNFLDKIRVSSYNVTLRLHYMMKLWFCQKKNFIYSY
jgi:hypothetical protein